MKKWIVLVLVLVLGGGAIYVYRTISGVDDGEYKLILMTDAEIADRLGSPDLKERLDAVAQLEKLAPAARKTALLDALGAAAAAARLTAVVELGGEFGTDAEVVTALLDTAKEDPDPDVKGAAFTVLTKSGDPRVLSVATEVLASDASLAARLGAAKTLDALTGRNTAKALETSFDAAGEAADDLGMEWDDWITENADGLKWNAETGRFE